MVVIPCVSLERMVVIPCVLLERMVVITCVFGGKHARPREMVFTMEEVVERDASYLRGLEEIAFGHSLTHSLAHAYCFSTRCTILKNCRDVFCGH